MAIHSFYLFYCFYCIYSTTKILFTLFKFVYIYYLKIKSCLNFNMYISFEDYNFSNFLQWQKRYATNILKHYESRWRMMFICLQCKNIVFKYIIHTLGINSAYPLICIMYIKWSSEIYFNIFFKSHNNRSEQ